LFAQGNASIYGGFSMAMFDCFWGQRSENASAAWILLPLKVSSKYVYGTENLQISTQDLIKTIMHLAIP